MASTREIPPTAVDRPRLLAQLDAGVLGALTLVLGPSGSGKTVLLRQWAASRPDQGLPWVRIDPTLADAVSFGRRLVATIERQHPGFGTGCLPHLELGGTRMGQPFLEALRSELADLPPTVLVLDDLHVLPTTIVEELGALVTGEPTPLHLVAASRLTPSWPLARLRAQGQVQEVRAADLALTPPEAAEVVRRIGRASLATPDLTLLHERTEGWAVGVQLAALAVRDGGEISTVLSPHAGATVRHVAEYLTEEVVSQQPAEVAAFLWRTCLLDQLHPDLCDELTGRRDGRRLLGELQARNLFLVPADDRPGWYRYHALFAEVLRHHLQVEAPDAVGDALAQAARWHLERDDLEPAVEYLLRAERWQDALDVIAADGWTFYTTGRAATAIRWLESVPSTVLRDHHHADTTLITLHRVTGNAARADELLEERARTVAPGSRKDMGRHVFSAIGVTWGRDPADCLAHAEAALAWLADPPPGHGPAPDQPDDDDARVAVRLAGGRALHLLERWDEARAWFETNIAETGGKPPMRVRSLAALACLEVDLGNLEKAHVLANRGLRLAGELGGADPNPLSELHLALGVAAYERDQLDEAAAHLRSAEDLARVNRCTVVVARSVAARALLDQARGRAGHGVERTSAWRREGDGPTPEAVEAHLGAAEARCLLAAGEPTRAKRALARAPRRPATLAVAARAAAEAGDVRLLRAVLDPWPDSPCARARIEHAAWQAWLAEQQGDTTSATTALLGAARLAEVDGNRRALIDGGPAIAELVATVTSRLDDATQPGAAALRDLHQAAEATAAAHGADHALSEREVEVLALLATRATTAEIARQLGVSPNTLKTHLRRIYRKLDAGTRRAAVEAGEEQGILGRAAPGPQR